MALANTTNVADPFVVYALKFLVQRHASDPEPRVAETARQLLVTLTALQADATNAGSDPANPPAKI